MCEINVENLPDPEYRFVCERVPLPCLDLLVLRYIDQELQCLLIERSGKRLEPLYITIFP